MHRLSLRCLLRTLNRTYPLSPVCLLPLPNRIHLSNLPHLTSMFFRQQNLRRYPTDRKQMHFRPNRLTLTRCLRLRCPLATTLSLCWLMSPLWTVYPQRLKYPTILQSPTKSTDWTNQKDWSTSWMNWMSSMNPGNSKGYRPMPGAMSCCCPAC
jgi:hypothetical protein